jgi:hypothetical protein
MKVVKYDCGCEYIFDTAGTRFTVIDIDKFTLCAKHMKEVENKK